ncbi:helix-turn-helix transcriptional regulator [Actinoplanes siamensis]|uniref:AlpA family transcriptional regulator n=1 Tax=Actinoplanes siamensis TaxID=1223317 RepID=A0A919N5C4_9ACTN|nr:hypothetical protein [Actinoplanes siamensis]GIF04636.1 hypothetical protein Asi03nite_21740 [Actinoplanes siamensis]
MKRSRADASLSGILRLVGAREIAVRLGLSRQRIQQLADRDDFPVPFQELTMGRVWWAHEVEEWIRRRQTGQSSCGIAGHGSKHAARQSAERVADHLAERSHVFLEEEQVDALAKLLCLFLGNNGHAAGSEGPYRPAQVHTDTADGIR